MALAADTATLPMRTSKGLILSPYIYPHISHINPAGLAVISNGTTRCSRIAERSAYHEC